MTDVHESNVRQGPVPICRTIAVVAKLFTTTPPLTRGGIVGLTQNVGPKRRVISTITPDVREVFGAAAPL